MPDSVHVSLMGTSSAPCLPAMAWSFAAEPSGFSASRMNAVPIAYWRPPCVNGSSAVFTRIPSRRASAAALAAPDPHGIRNPIVPAGGAGAAAGVAAWSGCTSSASTLLTRSLATMSTSNMSGRLQAVMS